MKRRLAQFRGVLTPAQIATGINVATRNARRLCDDASLMFERGRSPSAIGLAILSIEESGKTRVLRELALARNEDDIKSAWREYRSHTSKNQLWLVVESLLKGASKLGDFSHLFDPDSDHPQMLDQLKQISLYTDCLGNAHWSTPEEVVDNKLARSLVTVAAVLSHSREVTQEEIDLWIFHMQPVYKTTTEAMERALMAWDKDMRARGLLKEDPFTMEEFIKRGFKRR